MRLTSRMDSIQAVEQTKDDLAELYRIHAPRLRALAYLLTGNPSDAEELVQEAFARVVGRFLHIRRRSSVGACLRRALVNLHTSRLRRLRLERRHLTELKAQPSPVSTIPDIEGTDELVSALLRVPPRQRAAVVLRYGDDMSEEQVATPCAVREPQPRT